MALEQVFLLWGEKKAFVSPSPQGPTSIQGAPDFTYCP